MAGMTNNNLYPPSIAAYMPSFVRTSGCKVYFSLSSYNNPEDIKNVQVTVSNQNNNISALNEELYPAGIMITNLLLDENAEGDAKYYVIISAGDLIGEEFELNQYYKVQIRFTGLGASALTDSKKIASWLTNNQSYFSEWSTVCLIKGIEKPDLYIKGLEDANESSEMVFSIELIDLVGRMFFENNENIEKEYLSHYNVALYNNSIDTLLFESGDVYTNEYNPNEINYTMKYMLQDGVSYRLVITYVTNNGYVGTKTYIFAVIQHNIDSLRVSINAEADNENGRVKVTVRSNTSAVFLGNLTIKRSSNESGFKIWEDIYTTVINDGMAIDLTWFDYTAESGVWYKYCVQKRNAKGNRGSAVTTRHAIMLDLEDMFLVHKDMQLRIRYNPTISSFKTTVVEAKTDTIGSKYPHFRRNGSVSYKQFPISGLITAFCDDEGIFISKDSIYGEYKVDYDQYNDENRINEYNDQIYEREFRRKIVDFLYENNVKLFKSGPEGNVLVRLMDVSFIPNQTLGRMLYQFNATAYEVDECSIENYDKYKVQPIGKFNPYVEFVYDKIGQVRTDFAANQDLILMLGKKYENVATSGIVNSVEYVKWLRIECESDPYFIRAAGSGVVEPWPQNEVPTEDAAYGYIVYINGKPIIISPRGFYELNDSDTTISSVYFPVDTTATIDYLVEMSQIEDTSKLADKIYYYTKVGQMWGTFNINEYLYTKIYLKYFINYKAYYQRLIDITQMNIEALPGTVVYIKDSTDDIYFRHEIGPTGVLNLKDDNTTIDGFYFAGIHLRPTTKTKFIRDEEYVDTGIVVTDVADIVNPIKNGVYTVNGDRRVYFQEQWWPFSDDDLVLCPIEGTIDYIYELTKGEY